VALRQAAELRRQLAVEAAAEAAAISAAAVLREELVAAEADAQEEHDRHELLHPEVLEREGRALELAQALDAHRHESVELRANVANLKEDIGKLWKEHGWARRYMGQAEARRARLQTEVQEAERGLATQQAHGRVARMTHCVAHSSDLRSQLEAHQASEAHEAERAQRASGLLAELEARRAALQLELMKEEHHRSYFEQCANSTHRALNMRGSSSPSALVPR